VEEATFRERRGRIFEEAEVGGWVGSWGDVDTELGGSRVRNLMRLLGVEAIYPRKRLSLPAKGYQIYPYLLREVEIDRPNKVWAADITYIRLKHGFVYLVAVMEVYSRYIISWRLANTLEPGFCCEV